jgi:hypothetical protein
LHEEQKPGLITKAERTPGTELADPIVHKITEAVDVIALK